MKRSDFVGTLENRGWTLMMETYGYNPGPELVSSRPVGDGWAINLKKTVELPGTSRMRLEDWQASVYVFAATLADAREEALRVVSEWERLA